MPGRAGAVRGQAARSVLVVGGGASGVIMAAHLLRAGSPGLRVTIVEKRPQLGRGIAYSTTEPDHLLNVRAANMSALADDPGHFARWLGGRGISDDMHGFYAPRMLYGEYLGQLAETLSGASKRLERIENTCVAAIAGAAGIEARLADGSSIAADAAVLATGHEENPLAERPYAVRFGAGDAAELDRQAPVLILGTGLSMVDTWLSLERRGHRGSIVALSRSGLLPNGHRRIDPVSFAETDLPLGEDPAAVLQWLRDTVCGEEASDGDWRCVVDGLRPFNQKIWRSWTVAQQRRFFRHCKTVWHVHRHRMAPEIFERVSQAKASGRLRVVAGRLGRVEQDGGGWKATLRRRGASRREAFHAARIYDCAGVATDPAKNSNPLIRALLGGGAARTDPTRIGLDVTEDCALIDGGGAASNRLFAVGPLTRGTFGEIEAVPDIRLQCAALALRLAG